MNGAKIRRESRAFHMISKKLKASEWGSNVVRQLSEYIRTQDPTIKGWSYRTIYKMVQFYETYSSESFKELMQSTKLAQFTKMELPSAATGFVPFEMAQIMPKEFVPTELAQIPSVLFFTGWSNHQLILNRCKTNEERLFYIIYSKKELLGYKQLERAIKTDAMASILRAKDIQSEALHTTHAKSPAPISPPKHRSHFYLENHFV